MGSMNFHVPGTLPAGGAFALERAQFVGGYDRSPFPTRVDHRTGLLALTKAQNESCSVSAPWPLAGLGFPVSTTATLREKAEPYHLLVELARGKLNQLRNAVAELKMQGLEPSADVQRESLAAVRLLAAAALQDAPGAGDADATAALVHCYAGSQALLRQFTATAIELRTQNNHRIPMRWSCRIASVPSPAQSAAFVAAFSNAVLVPDWAALEVASTKYDWAKLDDLVDWAHANGFQPTIGPLIDFGEPLPAWLDGWEGELPSLSAFFCDFVESIVHRYGSKIKNWILCSGFNHTSRYSVSEDDRLRLVGRLLELARTLDPEAKWTIGLAQPWGDYLGGGDHTYSPLVFADTLLRSGLPIGGFELEIFAGDDDRASLLRDGLDSVRLLDLFGLLGIPIDVVARHPGRSRTPTPTDFARLSKCWKARDDEESQAAWGDWVSSLALCYAHIRSFAWGEWADETDEGFGLVAADGRVKPLLASLQKHRGHCAG
jgi:hypothetical protein